jgi:hypothetical protein
MPQAAFQIAFFGAGQCDQRLEANGALCAENVPITIRERAHGRATLRLAEAAYESRATGRRVTIGESDVS